MQFPILTHYSSLTIDLNSGHQHGACRHHVTHKDEVGRPQACSKNNISMLNPLTTEQANKLARRFLAISHLPLESCSNLLRIHQAF